jgi:hypothetical protein
MMVSAGADDGLLRLRFEMYAKPASKMMVNRIPIMTGAIRTGVVAGGI